MRIGHYDNHAPPPRYNPGGDGGFGKSREDIAQRVNHSLVNYERFLQGKQEDPGALTEFNLVVLGTYIRRYVPQQMPRYEEVLAGLRDRIDVDWIKDLLYGRHEQIGIGATVGDPRVKAPPQPQPQP